MPLDDPGALRCCLEMEAFAESLREVGCPDKMDKAEVAWEGMRKAANQLRSDLKQRIQDVKKVKEKRDTQREKEKRDLKRREENEAKKRKAEEDREKKKMMMAGSEGAVFTHSSVFDEVAEMEHKANSLSEAHFSEPLVIRDATAFRALIDPDEVGKEESATSGAEAAAEAAGESNGAAQHGVVPALPIDAQEQSLLKT